MIESLFVWFLQLVNYIVLVYFVLLNTTYLITSFGAIRWLKKYSFRLKSIDLDELMTSAGAPPITMLAPAFNEEATVVESTQSLLTLRYPSFEIVLINDGSADGTLERLKESFDLSPAPRTPTSNLQTATVREIYHSRRHRELWVIDKENGGKSDALNAGINFCRTPLFCAMDADSLLERDSLLRIVRPFLEDATTVAAGGVIRIANGCTVESGLLKEVQLPRGLLAQFQVVEYLRAFLASRVGWHALKGMLIVSGAFGVFSRRVVADAGGYDIDTVGEDMELVVRLHRHCLERGIPYSIAFIPDPVAWTECPETIASLGRQRDRWQRGLGECLWRHRDMMFNPQFGRIGLLAYPYYFFLEMGSSIIELIGYFSFALSLVLGTASPTYIATFLLVALVFGVVLSVSAVGLEELCFRRYPNFKDVFRLFLIAILENFGYRQLSVYWRVRGFFAWLRRTKGWGEQERRGFGGAAGGGGARKASVSKSRFLRGGSRTSDSVGSQTSHQ